MLAGTVSGSPDNSVNRVQPQPSGLGRLCRPSLCRSQHPRPEQVEVRPAVHLPLDRLEPGHLAFRLPVAAVLRQRPCHRRPRTRETRRGGAAGERTKRMSASSGGPPTLYRVAGGPRPKERGFARVRRQAAGPLGETQVDESTSSKRRAGEELGLHPGYGCDQRRSPAHRASGGSRRKRMTSRR